MTEPIDVSAEVYIAAPEGQAVYAQNPSYTAVEGQTLVEGVKHEALHFAPGVGRVYYHSRIFRRRSVDNGRTWSEQPDLAREDPERLRGEHRHVPMHVLDPHRDVLLSFHTTYEIDPDEPMFRRGNRRQSTYRTHYELSGDGGLTWSPPRQVIDGRQEYDAVHWGPGLEYGRTGGVADLGASAYLDDGTLVFGLSVTNLEPPPDAGGARVSEHCAGVLYLQARWDEVGEALEFTFGDLIRVAPDRAVGGCCEPAVVSLGGSRLFNAMRCQGDEGLGIPSSRQTTVSDDGGLTWSSPEPLRYDDGSPVWTPASFSQFYRSSKTGRTYWLANILDGPVYGQMPRYPLAIAEFDADRCCILRKTVQTIHDLPRGAPRERRYTNWGAYEDRETGDLVLTMPEQPKSVSFSDMTRPEDFTADCIRLRVRLGA